MDKAKWVNLGSTVGLIDDYRCSNCNHQPDTKKIGLTWGWDLSKHCPYCKSEMINPKIKLSLAHKLSLIYLRKDKNYDRKINHSINKGS